MVNEKRVRLMTKLAEIEQRDDAMIEQARSYYRADYVGIHLLKNGLRITVAFLIGLALFGFRNADSLMKRLNTMNIVGIGMQILFVYGVLLVLYLGLSYLIFSIKFYRSNKRFQTYQNILDRLLVEYEKEGDTRKRKQKPGGIRNGNIRRN